ncbi:LLM class flavin-dependent oxidoreductase [Lentzea sp. NPDC042327]|uniref:LLM class flavin-dependent oxidoreductase n=1 Tax=Lentzea sp. NPDC042327 TaxID=3154801 RepID=UPI003410D662
MSLRLGVTVPEGLSGRELREFARRAESLGYDHLSVAEHLSSHTPAYESATLVAHLAAVTTRIELCTCMLILPHRPVVLAAKQAAQLSDLAEGRLRLGVAAGGDPAESAALGLGPATRAALFGEQLAALRRLWTGDEVSAEGAHVTFGPVTLTPRPTHHIPLWLGGGSLRTAGRPGQEVLLRTARHADGFTMSRLLANRVERGSRVVEALRGALSAVGRDPSAFGVEARLLPERSPDWRTQARSWKEAGATHLTVTTDDSDLLAQVIAAMT